MLKDVSSSKLCFEEEIVKLIVCNKYVFLKFSAIKYLKCNPGHPLLKSNATIPTKINQEAIVLAKKSKRKLEKKSCIKSEEMPILKNYKNGSLQRKNQSHDFI